jgi:short-subunit dehydrogenase
VTGAARGVGSATAIALAQRGIAPVLLVRDPAAANATQQAVLALGVTCGVLQADVADGAQVARAFPSASRWPMTTRNTSIRFPAA